MISICIVLLFTLCAMIGFVAAWRRPPYTFAEWRKASERICAGMREVCGTATEDGASEYNASIAHPGAESGVRSQRRMHHALLQSLLANTVFIINLVNGGVQGASTGQLSTPEMSPGVTDVLRQGVGLLLRLHAARLHLWLCPAFQLSSLYEAIRPTTVHQKSVHHKIMTAAQEYVSLCEKLIAFLDHLPVPACACFALLSSHGGRDDRR